MIFWITNDPDLSPKRPDDIALRDSLLSVIGTFRVDVWPYREEQFGDCRFVEYGYQVNRVERGYNLGPLKFGQYRSALPLEPGYLVIRINSDYQNIAQITSAFEISNVPNVQDVEASVCQDDAFSFFLLGAYQPDKVFAFQDQRSRLSYFNDSRTHRYSLALV